MSSRNQQFSGSRISTSSKQNRKERKDSAGLGANKLVAALKPVLEYLEPRQLLSAGTPDVSFNFDGKRTDDTGFQDLAHATLIEPNGNLLVAGESKGRFALSQYDNAGSLNWQSVNAPGFPLSSVSAITMQGGKIIVAGTALDTDNGDSEFALARYNDNGTLDTSFGNQGTAVTDQGADTRDIAYGVAVQSDGKIVVVGSTGGAGQEDVALARYSSEGELAGIVTLPQPGSQSANAVAIGAGDVIIVAGHDGSGTLIQQFDADGNLLATHTEHIGGTDSASGVAIVGSNYVVGGTVDGDFYAARFDSSLALDSGFGSSGVTRVDFGGNDSASGMAIAPDGKIVLAGTTDNGALGTQDFAVARLSAEGSPDGAFGAAGRTTVDFNGQNDVGAAVAVGEDRKIVAVGYTAAGSNDDFAVTRLEGNSAPVIGTAAANLDAIDEDAMANTGNSVAELAGRLGITDADGDVAGLAITGSDDTNGTWEYTTDGGTDWTAIGAVTPGTALLLSVNTLNRIRFVPAADFNTDSGPTPTFSVVAWDGVQGTDGSSADVTDNSAHLNSFGDSTGTLSQSIAAVNDAPSFTSGGDQTVLVGSAPQTVTGWATNLSSGPADESGQMLSFVVSEVSDPNNVVSGVTVDPNTGTLSFTPGNVSGVATFSVSLKDNGGGTDTSAPQTFSISVADLKSETWVNDNWQVTNDVGTPGLSQGDTVADTGAGDDGAVTGKIYGVDAFSTIGDGVNFTAAGGTEHVISGSYDENVVINKALDLAGWGEGNTFIYPSISGANTDGGSLGDGVSSVILVQSDDVSIHNLTIDGDNTSLTGPTSADVNGANIDARNGIITDHLSGVYNNLNVHDTTVRNIFLRGIYASSGGTFDLSNNTVDNVAGSAASIGIFNFGGAGNISGNTVTRANDAISANHSRGTTFTDNHVSQSGSGIHSDNAGDGGGTPDVISGNDISDGGAGSYGIFVFVPYNTVTVSGNTVNGVEVGLAAYGGAGGLAQFDNNQVNVIAGGTGAFVTTDQLGFGSGDAAANFSGNSIAGGVTGLAAEETGGSTAVVNLSGGSIGGMTTGIDATAGSTVNVDGVSISGNETGIRYSGGAGGQVSNVNFDGGTNNGTDLLLADDAGTVNVGGGNAFAGDSFYIDNESAQNIDLTGNGTSFDESNNFRIEDKIFHKVDDSSKGLITWVANNVYVTTPGAGSTDSSIQRGIDAASSGDTVNVEAGTYLENPTVNKSLTLLGANAGVAGSAARGAETVVQTNGASQSAVFTVTANNVEISGFTLDGDDPNFAGATLGSGDDTNTSYGVRPGGAFNHITVDDNIIRHVAIGFRGDGASQNNAIANNWFDSVGLFDFGYAISLRQSFYADITDNLMTRVWSGVHLNDFHLAGGPASWTMSGNEIHSYAGGLLYWLQYGQATSLTIDDNHFSAEIGATANNFGVLMVSIQDAIHPTFTNNTVSGQDYGIGLFDVSTNNPITLDGTNSVTGSKLAGVLLTDNLNFNPVGTTNFLAGGAGAASAVNIDGLSISGNAGDGIRVDASLDTAQTVNIAGATLGGGLGGVGLDLIGSKAAATVSGSAINTFGTGIKVAGGTLTLGSGDSITGGSTGMAISGSSAVLGGDTLSDLALTGLSGQYITLSDNALDDQEIDGTAVEFDGVTGASASYTQNYAIEDRIDHAVDDASLGFIRVKAGNVFVTTGSGSIQRGVDVASVGDQVNVADGTYTEQVDIGKDLTLQGQSQDGTIIQSPALLTGSFVWSGITYRPIVMAHDATVTVAQLTVNGDGQGNANSRFAGIGYDNAGGSIDHTTVIGVRDRVLDGAQHGYAIIARDDDAAARTLDISENTVSDYQKNGIDIRGAGLDANISGNSVSGAGDTAVIAQNGIVVIDAKAQISGNTVSGNEYSGDGSGADFNNDEQAAGILLLPAASGSVIDGNFIDGNDIGIYSLGSGITLSNNHLGDNAANRYEGILVDAGDTTINGNSISGGNFGIATLPGSTIGLTLNNNTVSGAGVGIDINDASGDVSGNHLYGNQTAIQFENGGTGSVAGNDFSGGVGNSDNGTDLLLSSDAGTVTIGADNHFAGDTFFINNQTAQNFNLVGNGTTFDETNNFRIEDKMFHKVDDASKGLITWVANNVYVTTPGAGSTDSSIQRGVDAASSGDTVNVEAGNYQENISIGKSLSVIGPQAGVAGRDNARGSGEAIITTNGPATAIFDVSAPNVTISGFTLEGNDPSVTTATLTSGVDSDVLYGIRAVAGVTGGLSVTDNIIKDVFVGVRGDATASAASINNLIKDNWFDSIGAFDFGYAVTTRTNFYADVIDNLMTRVQSGVLNLNQFIAGPATWTMSGNEIHSYAAGLWQNGQDSTATPLTVDGNTFSAEAGAAVNNIGVLLTGVNNPGIIFTNNTISGQDYGIIIFGSSSNITLDGSNAINGGGRGLYVTDSLTFNPVGTTAFGVGTDQSVTVDGLKISGAAVAGIVAHGGSKSTTLSISGTPVSVGAAATGISATNATLTFGAGNSITGGTTGLAIDGAAAVVSGNTLSDLTLSGQSGNYIALSNNALDDQVIDATAVSFDGVTGTAASHAQRLAIEGKIHDQMDDATLGLIQIAPPDVTRPTVIASEFHFEDAPQRITIQFSEYVKDSLSLDDITLVELLSNTTISPDNMTLTYNDATNTATITFHDLPANYLPTGRYKLTVNSAGVTDDSGNPLDGDGNGGDYVLTFFTMNGDANRDGMVSFADLVAVAQHYGIDDGSQTWATGDFNYDGKVDFADLVAVAQNYGKTLPPAPDPMTAAAVSAPVVAAPADAPVLAAAPMPTVAQAAKAVSSPVSSALSISPVILNPAPVAVKPPSKPVVVTKAAKGISPIQASANAPFAVRTQLRVQNPPASLIGQVVQKKDSGDQRVFR